MDRKVRLVRLRADYLPAPAAAGRLGGGFHELSGYILEQTSTSSPRGMVVAWGVMVVAAGPFGRPAPEPDTRTPVRPRRDGTRRRILRLEPVGRLVPLPPPRAEPAAPTAVRSLRPVRNGQAYRITSASTRGLVTPRLAEALECVFERFAHECRFTPEKPLDIQLAPGFKAGSHGQGEDRAADIAAVAGKSLAAWKQDWERATATADELSDAEQRAEAITAEQKRNLGQGLYKAPQAHGGSRVDQAGWPPLPPCHAALRPVDRDRRPVEADADQRAEPRPATAPGRSAMGPPSASGSHPRGEVSRARASGRRTDARSTTCRGKGCARRSGQTGVAMKLMR